MHWSWNWFTITTLVILAVHLFTWAKVRARISIMTDIARSAIASVQGLDRDLPRSKEPGMVTFHDIDFLQTHGRPITTRDVDFYWWQKTCNSKMSAGARPFKLGVFLCAAILVLVALAGWSPRVAVSVAATVIGVILLIWGLLGWPTTSGPSVDQVAEAMVRQRLSRR